ncbi:MULTISPECIES: hypothetical protein [Elizabethkingia]|uniref:hypothetical protein n=1 Tax=Elizabethkingia TaxID=308865 RepID=UPI000999EAE4|nr:MULTISPECIES: hypothetical protein [Elizabethkingia]AQX90544.1 hypothetical protein AYC67_16640 [Elizabethkingia anophelis]EHM7980959.1 hypothetical protein [Elizabethkingia anophelis]EHM8032178.1 hypothetical protein [Elizabethkingia anophelis]EHM8033929.1 hypothetical protein [Elizabethkingia anophelis]EHZ9535132.1 hypothetical protein [Elizabethkingia anophelis]
MQHRVFIIILAIYGISICQLSGQLPKVFSGKFSSEGDITAKGIITMELTQSGNKIEGVSVYQTNDGQLNTGLLSVNGYTKDNLGYIRFRDQKGNVVADGSINFKETGTLHFKQTTKSSFLPFNAFLYSQNSASVEVPSSPARNYTGKYSNEGDTTAAGIISFEISQTGSKVEGIANYKTFNNSLDTGVLSVNGYVKNGIAYIRFRDQKGNAVADGALSPEGKNTIFRQTTLSNLLPHYATLYR